jgi:hypothetical protein
MREQAQRLRAEGMTVREIAEQLGVPRTTVGDWVKARRSCPECGSEMGCHGHRSGHCRSCEAAYRHWRGEVLLSVIEGCWADGWLLREIGAALGRRSANPVGPEIDELRRRGRVSLRHHGSYAEARPA